MTKETNISREYVRQYRQQLGAKIKDARVSANLDPQQLGDEVGILAATISKLESGKFSTHIDLYIKLAVVLNLKIEIV